MPCSNGEGDYRQGRRNLAKCIVRWRGSIGGYHPCTQPYVYIHRRVADIQLTDTTGNIVIRFATSTALAVGTSYYLLPKTTHNVGVQLEKLERRYPPLQEAHQEVNKVVLDARKQAENAWSQLLGAVDENSGKLLSQFRSQDQAKEQFENVKKSVESMYSTRSNVS